MLKADQHLPVVVVWQRALMSLQPPAADVLGHPGRLDRILKSCQATLSGTPRHEHDCCMIRSIREAAVLATIPGRSLLALVTFKLQLTDAPTHSLK